MSRGVFFRHFPVLPSQFSPTKMKNIPIKSPYERVDAKSVISTEGFYSQKQERLKNHYNLTATRFYALNMSEVESKRDRRLYGDSEGLVANIFNIVGM
jgi:hypothetical protein